VDGRGQRTLSSIKPLSGQTNTKSSSRAAAVYFLCGWVYENAAGLTAEGLREMHPDLLLRAGWTAKIMSHTICYTSLHAKRALQYLMTFLNCLIN